MGQKNIQVEVQGKNVLPTPIKNLRELATEVTQAGANATVAKALAEVNTEIVADKDYDTAKFSGMGRVNLHKNIVDGHNYLTQDMISKANTIYKIQYDYEIAPVTNSSVARLDQSAVIATFTYRYAIVGANVGDTITINPSLGDAIVYMENGVWTASDIDAHTPSIVVTESMTNVGVGSRTKGLQEVINYTKTTKSITIPENCVLDFEGGSLSGGSININNAKVLPSFNALDGTDVIGIPAKGTVFFIDKHLYVSDATKWIESDGATAGVQRAGLITKRPATSDIPTGFTYVVTASFDIGGTTYNAGVYAYIGSDNWITPDGTTVSDGTLPTRS